MQVASLQAAGASVPAVENLVDQDSDIVHDNNSQKIVVAPEDAAPLSEVISEFRDSMDAAGHEPIHALVLARPWWDFGIGELRDRIERGIWQVVAAFSGFALACFYGGARAAA